MARTLLPVIDPGHCTGCGRCVAACRPHVLSLEPRGWVKSSTLLEPGACTGCGACEAVCPFRAIALARINVRGLVHFISVVHHAVEGHESR